MSQFFTIFFPKYYFDVQKQFEITFDDNPFKYFEIIEDNGHIFVDRVSSNQQQQQQYKELAPGLRIIEINENNFEDQEIDIAQVEKLIQEKKSVKIVFCEEIEDEDEMYEQIEIEEKDNIIASSFQQGFEPFQAINDDDSFWKPIINQGSFIQIDLKAIKQITRLEVYGNKDHTMYINSLWIDYSNDGCQWKSHFAQETECIYDKNGVAIITIWPVLMARFIRIRVCKWTNYCALKIKLFGINNSFQTVANHRARVITLRDIDAENKKGLLKKTKHLSVDTKVIQVDCEQVIRGALNLAGIKSVSFIACENTENLMCIFSTKNTNESEESLNCLTNVGIGKEIGIINIMTIDYRNQPKISTTTNDQIGGMNKSRNHDYNVEKYKKSEKTSFAQSVKSRKLVQEVIDSIMKSSELSFDYLMMLLVAASIATGGLATGNSVIIVASMLVSPIMGPVLALTFGVTLNEWHMTKIGLKNEIFSLIICIIVGFIFGLLYALISANSMDWPTDKMMSRGAPVALADGAFIAAVSGVGVALSVLGEYASMIIGVAISGK